MDEEFSPQMALSIERSCHNRGLMPPSPPRNLRIKEEAPLPPAQHFGGVQIGRYMKKKVKRVSLSPPRSTDGQFFQSASQPCKFRCGKETTLPSPPRRSRSQWRPVKMEEAPNPIATACGRLLRYLACGGDGDSSLRSMTTAHEAAEQARCRPLFVNLDIAVDWVLLTPTSINLWMWG